MRFNTLTCAFNAYYVEAITYDKTTDTDWINGIWEKISYAKIKALNKKEIIIEANSKGFLSLSKLFKSVSEYRINSAKQDIATVIGYDY